MNHDLFSEETQNEIKGFGRPVAGWFCTYTPLELMDAAGLTSVRIAGEHGTCSNAESVMHTNICPYIKSCLEAAETGKLDFLDAIVFTNGCDAQRRLYDFFKERKPEFPSFLLNAPKTVSDASINLFAAEISSMKEWLEKSFDKTVSDEQISLSIETYKLLRARSRGLDGARRRSIPTLTGSRALELMMMIQRMTPAAAMALITQVEAALRPVDIGPKVIVAGNIMDDPAWIRKLEEYGAHVFADDLCTARRFWLMPEPDKTDDPVHALAKAYLTKPPCPRMAVADDTVSEMERLIDNLQPDGVIFHIMKFCDTHMYNVPRMRNMLRDKGVKALFIESDYTSGAGQVETRLQAFIEML